MTVLEASAASGPKLPGLQKLTKVNGENVKGKPASGPAESDLKAWKGAPKIAWPAAGSAEIALPDAPKAEKSALKSATGAGAFGLPAKDTGMAGKPVKAGKLPVSVAAVTPTAASGNPAKRSMAAGAPAAAATDVKLKVDLLDQAAAKRVGRAGSLLLNVNRTDAGKTSAPV
ncbi:hypothetical protein, partial [Streptomyces sp. NPDC051211]|uniref:hypothetical protein n=1 Tax=Streptomyces sp. NPDC051211 TaxID=3154643 RepID=UPI00344E9ECA